MHRRDSRTESNWTFGRNILSSFDTTNEDRSSDMLYPRLFISLFTLQFSILSASLAGEDRPNVIIIYTDDQGTMDLGCYGSDDLATPHLDKLASRGVRFKQMYSPSAICSASRAGLLTGRFPARAGVPGNVSSEEGVAGMSSSEVTIAEMMQAAGYATGHIGKWHLGYTPETMPNNQGFDHSWGHMGGCIDNYSHFFFWKGPIGMTFGETANTSSKTASFSRIAWFER